jgi:hypothetical protein
MKTKAEQNKSSQILAGFTDEQYTRYVEELTQVCGDDEPSEFLRLKAIERVRTIEVSEKAWELICSLQQYKIKLERLRAYLLPELAQQAKNVAAAAAQSISDLEAMKRSREMLGRIENEESENNS